MFKKQNIKISIILLFLVVFCTINSFTQTVSYFNGLYKYYESNFFKRISDFYIKDISFGFRTNYDSNFFSHPYLIEKDNSIIISNILKGAYLFKNKIIVETLPTLSYVNHFDHLEYNHLNRNLLFNLYYKFTHRMLLSGRYVHNIGRLRLYDTFGRIALFKKNTYGMELSYETARQTSIHFNYNYLRERVSGELIEENLSFDNAFSRNETIFGIDFRYKFKAKNFFNLSVKKFWTDFIYSDKRNAKGYDLSISLRFPEFGVESKINGNITFGIKTYKLKYYCKNYVEWIGNTDISYASGHFKYRLKLNRNFIYSVWQNSPIINTYFYLGTDYYFSKKIFVGTGYTYGKLNFKEPFIIGWERKFVKADYGTPILSFGLKTFYDYWLLVTLSFSDWNSDQWYYYNDKKRTIASISIVKK